MVTPKQIVEQIKDLNLPKGEYIAFGSVPLCLHGIRDCDDIDLFVSPQIYQKFKTAGWQETEYTTLRKGPFEAGADWKFGAYNPALKELLARAKAFDGVPVASLKDVVAWKTAFGREKDKVDIELVETYLRNRA